MRLQHDVVIVMTRLFSVVIEMAFVLDLERKGLMCCYPNAQYMATMKRPALDATRMIESVSRVDYGRWSSARWPTSNSRTDMRPVPGL